MVWPVEAEVCHGASRALPPHFTDAHIFVIAVRGPALTATGLRLQFSPSLESRFSFSRTLLTDFGSGL